MSIPGVGAPLLDKGKLFVDGGFLNNLPSDVMLERCRGSVIAVDVGRSIGWRLNVENLDTVSAGDFFKRRILPGKEALQYPHMLEILVGSALLSSASGAKMVDRTASLIIQPPLSGFGLFDWQSIDELIEIGYQAACVKLEEWQACGRARS
jgi:predicted acylesterase/phospholipase RssA